MTTLIGILFFIFGTIIGSFLNVVILRYNTGMSVQGRSFCTSCARTLKWYELIPLFSFLALRGRCRTCESKLSKQYPIVEALTGILFLLVSLKIFAFGSILTFAPTVYALIVISLLVVISVYDMRHKIIPDAFVYAFILLSLMSIFIDLPILAFSVPSFWVFMSGPIIAAPFAFLWLVSHGEWMGFGDAKLALGIGWMLGIESGFSAVIWGFWTGAIWGVGILFLGYVLGRRALEESFLNKRLYTSLKGFTMKSEVPFAPFLILGIFIVYFFGLEVLTLFM